MALYYICITEIMDYPEYDTLMNEDYADNAGIQQDYYSYFTDDLDPNSALQYRLEEFSVVEEWQNLCFNCMGTVLFQSFFQLRVLLISCLVARFACYFSAHYFSSYVLVRDCIIHIFFGLIGLLVLYDLNSANFLSAVKIILIYILLSYTFFFILSKFALNTGTFISIFTVFYLFSGELLYSNPMHWHQIRGVLLLLSMKVISVALDYDRQVIKGVPQFFVYFGYLLHNGTCVFGPWISIDIYIDAVANPKPFSIIWISHILKSFVKAFICLLLSTCVFSYLFIDQLQPEMPAVLPIIPNNWLAAYQVALSFHFSHYYVCYLSQATCMMSGIGTTKSHDSMTWSNFIVTKPLQIEIPSSMLDVVVAWNIPMSRWLKKYVFDTYSYMGRSAAIVLTYTASAILHGLSFHLAAVLLSLAFYTYVEYELRNKLSIIFDCIHIRARNKTKNTTCPIWAHAFNFVWILINLMHLAYLGSMFHSDDEGEIEAEGFAMKHTLHKWSKLGFFSHWFALGCALFNYLI